MAAPLRQNRDMAAALYVRGAAVKLVDQPPRTAKTWDGSWPTTRDEFVELVEAYQHQLVRYAFRRLGCLQDAEDVVQEVFTLIYAQMGKPKEVSHATGYLYRMVANGCTDKMRKRKYATTSLDAIPEERLPDGRRNAAEEAQALEELHRIDALLRRLPKRQAEVVWLRVFNDLSFAEAAEVLNCSVGTAKSRFRYGLKKIRALIKKESEVKS